MGQNEEGERNAAYNPGAAGNAWFIERLKAVPTSNEEILALDGLDVQNEAVVNSSKFPAMANSNYSRDSISAISLTNYKPNHLTYKSGNLSDGLAVFSEMYYANGWNAYIDGRPVNHFRVNYGLRALEVPAGNHVIEFKFEPAVIELGSKISIGSSVALLLVLAGGLYFTYGRRRKIEETDA